MSVQAVVNYHWRDCKVLLWSMVLAPYCVQLFCFFIWSNFIIRPDFNAEFPALQSLELWVGKVLFLTNFWFTLLEFNQLIAQRFIGYFMNPWNYVEALPLILIFVNMYRIEFGTVDQLFYRCQAVAAVTQWLKFMYFLRSFMETAYLIRMITNVFADMKQFVIIILITIIGFGDAFS